MHWFANETAELRALASFGQALQAGSSVCVCDAAGGAAAVSASRKSSALAKKVKKLHMEKGVLRGELSRLRAARRQDAERHALECREIAASNWMAGLNARKD